MLCSLRVVVATLIEYAIIILMGRTSDTYNKVECTTISKKSVHRRTLLAKKKGKYMDGKGPSGSHHQIQDKRSQELTGKNENRDCAGQTINAIDFYAFWSFLTVYLLFNISYWNFY